MIRIGRLLPGGVVIEEGQHRPTKGVALLSTSDGGTEELVVYAKKNSIAEHFHRSDMRCSREISFLANTRAGDSD